MKLLSSINYATQHASNRQGYLLGIEMFPFFKREVEAGVFTPPSIGTRGVSESDIGSATDISSATETDFNIAVNGGTPVLVSLVVAGLDTGFAIAAALESSINDALVAAGQRGRVEVKFDDGLAQYSIYSLNTGGNSSVVVTEGDGLKTVLSLGETETVGTYSEDYAFVKTAGFNFSQEIEMSEHRSGRQASNFFRKKKMVEGDTTLYVLLGDEGSPVAMSDAHKLLYESCFGRKVVDTPTELTFDCSQPHNVYFSALINNNGLGQTINGAYAKNWSLSLAGEAPANLSISSKARDSKMASISQIGVGASGVTSIETVAGEAKRFEKDSVVMIVASDGVTVSHGGEGDLKVVSVDDSTNTVVLSEAVTVQKDGFIAPWSPAYFGGIPEDSLRVATDLEGSVSLDGGTTSIGEITAAEVSVENNLTDLDNYYGADSNVGFVDGSRQEITCNLTLNLTVEEMRRIQQMKDFETFNVLIRVGGESGQRMEIKMPRVIFNIPSLELPAEGAVSLSFEGRALQTETGAMDAIQVSFKNA